MDSTRKIICNQDINFLYYFKQKFWKETTSVLESDNSGLEKSVFLENGLIERFY